ncbi:MAG: sulfotransferase [Granulosicoccus sp.]
MSNTIELAREYSALDKLLHRIAFIHPSLQRILGELENDLFKRSLKSVQIRQPVFIVGLPRAGTTLLLELLFDTNEFASFTYRQMPFVLNPLLWNKLTARSQQPAHMEQRAHGDNMKISYDSPEAFEEVLWKNHLTNKLFSDGSILPLDKTAIDNDFRTTFRSLVKKLIYLANLNTPTASTSMPRYLSKNNANLSRLDAITSVFDDATLLCCFRHPASHVASLHYQHNRFTDLHETDRFSQQYMSWIGHHDFGHNFLPTRFGQPNPHDPADRIFWLQYWIDAYQYVLDHAPPDTQFVCYESLLEDGPTTLAQISEYAHIDSSEKLIASADRLRAPTSLSLCLDSISTTLADKAESLYLALSERVQK